MFSRIRKEGNFVLSSGVKSSYNYDYSQLSDTMNEAYCSALQQKLHDWQSKHGKFDVVVGCETEGVRIGYVLSKLIGLPFHIMPKKSTDYSEVIIPPYPVNTHWLIVDDIVTTGSTYIKTVDLLDIEEIEARWTKRIVDIQNSEFKPGQKDCLMCIGSNDLKCFNQFRL